MPELFPRTVKTFEAAAGEDDPRAVRFVLARNGEDPEMVAAAHHGEHPNISPAVAVLYLYGEDAKPRQQLCSRASVAQSIPAIRSAVEAMTAPGSSATMQARGKALQEFWQGLCESMSVSWGKQIKVD